MGGVIGALGGYLMFHGARSMQERVIIGERYYNKLKIERESEVVKE